MKVLVVLLSLVAFCAAQPPRPKPPETFYSDYLIERHTNVTVFGTGFIARDASKEMGVENSTYTTHEMEYVLQRFDQLVICGVRDVTRLLSIRMEEEAMKMEYFITNYNQDRCRFRSVEGALPSFWDFLQLAKYVGQVVVRHITYDVWEFYAAGVRISLGVTPAAPDVPGILERDVAQNMVSMVFQNFKAGEADPKYFDVPSQCKQSSAHKRAGF